MVNSCSKNALSNLSPVTFFNFAQVQTLAKVCDAKMTLMLWVKYSV